MDYSDLNTYLLILSSRGSAAGSYVPVTQDYPNILPAAIDYAEGRILKDLVLLATRTQDSSLTFSGNSRTLNLTQMTTQVIIPEGLAAITPAGTIPALGTRWPFTNTSLDFIDITWPVASNAVDITTYPGDLYWAMLDATTIVVGPTPNAALKAEITGLFRPPELSADNPSTYLTTTYPELYVAACMIFISGYVRNFGAQADMPKMAQSWEGQYQLLKTTAFMEEQRRRGQGAGWSQQAPAPAAKPERT